MKEKYNSNIQINIDTARCVLDKFGKNIDSLDAVKMYFEKLHYHINADKNNSCFDSNGIIKLSEKLNFSKVSEKFKIIDSNTYPVYISVKDNQNEIAVLRNGMFSRQLFRNLQPFVVNVYENELKNLMIKLDCLYLKRAREMEYLYKYNIFNVVVNLRIFHCRLTQVRRGLKFLSLGEMLDDEQSPYTRKAWIEIFCYDVNIRHHKIALHT